MKQGFLSSWPETLEPPLDRKGSKGEAGAEIVGHIDAFSFRPFPSATSSYTMVADI